MGISDGWSKKETMTQSDVHTVAPDMAISFFKGILPFNSLDDTTLHDIARHCRIDFYPKGTRLLTAGKTEITHLYLIQRGLSLIHI